MTNSISMFNLSFPPYKASYLVINNVMEINETVSSSEYEFKDKLQILEKCQKSENQLTPPKKKLISKPFLLFPFVLGQTISYLASKNVGL